jgi:hypothetical protein
MEQWKSVGKQYLFGIGNENINQKSSHRSRLARNTPRKKERNKKKYIDMCVYKYE